MSATGLGSARFGRRTVVAWVFVALALAGFGLDRRTVRAQGVRLAGLVHESKPTEAVALAAVRVEVQGTATVVETDEKGGFALPSIETPATITFTRAGYETVRRVVTAVPPDGRLDVAMPPEPHDVTLRKSGRDDCADLPLPPAGVPGVREYGRFAVHHEGVLLVRSAQLPFASNQGYVYRLGSSGWEKNEFDFILLGMPLPLEAGFVYVITFGGGEDRCGPWSVDAGHPG